MEKRKTKEGRYDYCKSNSLPRLHFVGLKHSFWPHQLILSLSCSFVPLLINIKNKKIKSRIHHLSPHSRIKPETCHLATSPFSYLSHLTASSRPARAAPSIFRNLSLYSPPASPTLPTRYCSTFPTFPAHYPPIFPTLPLPFSSSLLTTLPTSSTQHLTSD